MRRRGAWISRKTGYFWLDRYFVEGLEGLQDRSRRNAPPRQVPRNRISSRGEGPACLRPCLEERGVESARTLRVAGRPLDLRRRCSRDQVAASSLVTELAIDATMVDVAA